MKSLKEVSGPATVCSQNQPLRSSPSVGTEDRYQVGISERKTYLIVSLTVHEEP